MPFIVRDISCITRVLDEVIWPDSHILMLFSFLSCITLDNYCKCYFPQLSIIPSPADYFYQHPIYHNQNNRDPACCKTYWGLSSITVKVAFDQCRLSKSANNWSSKTAKTMSQNEHVFFFILGSYDLYLTCYTTKYVLFTFDHNFLPKISAFQCQNRMKTY